MKTQCTITFEDGAIKESHLNLEATVDGIDEATFTAAVEEAKNECPISKLYNTTITCDATLIAS